MLEVLIVCVSCDSLDWHPNNYILACGSTDFKARLESHGFVISICFHVNCDCEAQKLMRNQLRRDSMARVEKSGLRPILIADLPSRFADRTSTCCIRYSRGPQTLLNGNPSSQKPET